MRETRIEVLVTELWNGNGRETEMGNVDNNHKYRFKEWYKRDSEILNKLTPIDIADTSQLLAQLASFVAAAYGEYKKCPKYQEKAYKSAQKYLSHLFDLFGNGHKRFLIERDEVGHPVKFKILETDKQKWKRIEKALKRINKP